MNVAVVGAGLSGATIAHVLAEAGYTVDLFERRDHVAGNCFTYQHETGITVHKYGPHIWHTNDVETDRFFRQFGPMLDYSLRMKSVVAGRPMSFPINLLTLCEFFGRGFTPEEAARYIATQRREYGDPNTFEGYLCRLVGPALYEAFYAQYTRKAWGVDGAQLPASLAKRIPVRYDFDDRAHDHLIQAMPVFGYTGMVQQMLNSSRIHLQLQTPYKKAPYPYVFYTGSKDEWFDYQFGRLPYRKVIFTQHVSQTPMYGCAVMCFADGEVPYVRAVEHRYFDRLQTTSASVVHRLYHADAGPDDERFYPTLGATNPYAKFDVQGVFFVGRLGTYQYLNMDQCIAQARSLATKFVEDRR